MKFGRNLISYGPDDGNGGGGSPDNKGNENNQNNTVTKEEFESLKSQLSSISDALKAMSDSNSKKEGNQENKENKNMKDGENSEAESETDVLKKQLTDVQNSLKKKDLETSATKELTKAGLTEHIETLMPLVIGADEKETEKNVQALKTVVDKIKAATKDELKAGKAVTGTPNSEDEKKELNDEVKKILGGVKNDGEKKSRFW